MISPNGPTIAEVKLTWHFYCFNAIMNEFWRTFNLVNCVINKLGMTAQLRFTAGISTLTNYAPECISHHHFISKMISCERKVVFRFVTSVVTKKREVLYMQFVSHIFNTCENQMTSFSEVLESILSLISSSNLTSRTNILKFFWDERTIFQ